MTPIFSFGSSKEFFQTRLKGKMPTRVVTKKMGYASPRLLEMVCRGDRLASEDFLFRARSFLRLTDQEFLYLQLLVRRDRERARGGENAQLEAEIQNFARLATDHTFLTGRMLAMVSEWPHFVLKQYLRKNRPLDYALLAKRLRKKISAADAKRVVKTLADLGFIYIDEEKQEIRPLASASLRTLPDIPSQAVRLHHQQMMARAQEALEEVPVLQREVISLTLAFDPKNLDAVKNEIRAFRQRIDSRYGSEPSDQVYQLNIQFFPQTEG